MIYFNKNHQTPEIHTQFNEHKKDYIFQKPANNETRIPPSHPHPMDECSFQHPNCLKQRQKNKLINRKGSSITWEVIRIGESKCAKVEVKEATLYEKDFWGFFFRPFEGFKNVLCKNKKSIYILRFTFNYVIFCYKLVVLVRFDCFFLKWISKIKYLSFRWE